MCVPCWQVLARECVCDGAGSNTILCHLGVFDVVDESCACALYADMGCPYTCWGRGCGRRRLGIRLCQPWRGKRKIKLLRTVWKTDNNVLSLDISYCFNGTILNLNIVSVTDIKYSNSYINIGRFAVSALISHLTHGTRPECYNVNTI